MIENGNVKSHYLEHVEVYSILCHVLRNWDRADARHDFCLVEFLHHHQRFFIIIFAIAQQISEVTHYLEFGPVHFHKLEVSCEPVLVLGPFFVQNEIKDSGDLLNLYICEVSNVQVFLFEIDLIS